MTAQSEHVRNIALDLVLTVLTIGLFNIYVQYRQMKAVNRMINEEKYHFGWWLFLTIITFGIYHIYFEFRMSNDIERFTEKSPLQILTVILCFLGLTPICDAIQQTYINKYFGSTKL